MNLQDKLIKSLERTIELQEKVIAEQDSRIRALELEKSMKQWYPLQEPYKSPQWPGTGPFWTSSEKWPNDFTVYGMTDEKKKQTQEGSGT